MRDHDNKCYTGQDNVEISYKKTYIQNLVEITSDVKLAITRELFDALEVQVIEDASYRTQNVVNINSEQVDL